MGATVQRISEVMAPQWCYLLQIEQTVIIESNSTTSGGVRYMQNFGKPVIIKSNFSNNLANFGAVFYLITQSNSLFQIVECVFIQNNSTNSGGAVYMKSIINILIVRRNFSYNSATDGAGIILFASQSNSFLELEDCFFIENKCIKYLSSMFCQCLDY